MTRFAGGIDAPNIGGGGGGGGGDEEEAGGGGDDSAGADSPGGIDAPNIGGGGGGGGGGAPEDDDDSVGGGTGGRTTPTEDDPRLPDNDGGADVGGGTGGRTTPDDNDPRLPDDDGGGGGMDDSSEPATEPDATTDEPMAGDDGGRFNVKTRSDQFTSGQIIDMVRGRNRQTRQTQRRREVTAASSDIGLALAARRDQPDVTAQSADVALTQAAQRQQPDVTATSSDVALSLAAQRDRPDVTAISSDIGLALAAKDAAPNTRRDRIRAAGAGFGTGDGSRLSDLPTDADGPTGELLGDNDIPSDIQVSGESRQAAIDPLIESDVAQTALGAPGTIESQIGTAVIERGQPVAGPPGQIEAAAGDIAFDIATQSGRIADTLKEQGVEPGAKVLSKTGGVGPGAAASTALGGDPDAVVSARRRIARGAGVGAVEATVGLPRAIVAGGQQVAEGGEAAATRIEEEGVEGAVESGEQALETAGETGVRAAASAVDMPLQTAGLAAGGAIVSAGAGRVLGRAARGARSRARTAGATEIDAEDLADEDVLSGADDFPTADEPDVVQRDPATAVSRQAERKTPTEIREAFEEAGVNEGAPLVKTVDVEPEGPGTGRSAQGFRAPEADTDLAQEFETSGTSFAPELSPRFLRLRGQSPEFRLRPGLPDLGDQPTAVVARTDVENPKARTTAEFDAELRAAEGETTAKAVRTEFEGFDPVAETEAQVPPGAEFTDVGTGPVRDPLRRLGVGADFATEIDGQSVPIRVVADEADIDAVGSRTPSSLFDDPRAQAGAAGARSRVTRQLVRRGRPTQPVDRPFPTAPLGSTAPNGTATPDESSTPAQAAGESATPVSAPREPTSGVSSPRVASSDGGSRGTGRETGSAIGGSEPSVTGGGSRGEPMSGPSEPSPPPRVSEPASPSSPSEPGVPSRPREPGVPSEPSTPGPPSRPGTPPRTPGTPSVGRTKLPDFEPDDPDKESQLFLDPFEERFAIGTITPETVAEGEAALFRDAADTTLTSLEGNDDI